MEGDKRAEAREKGSGRCTGGRKRGGRKREKLPVFTVTPSKNKFETIK